MKLAHRALWAAVFMTGLFYCWRGRKLFTAIQTRKQLLGLMVGAPCHHKLDGLFGSVGSHIVESAFGFLSIH